VIPHLLVSARLTLRRRIQSPFSAIASYRLCRPICGPAHHACCPSPPQRRCAAGDPGRGDSASAPPWDGFFLLGYAQHGRSPRHSMTALTGRA